MTYYQRGYLAGAQGKEPAPFKKSATEQQRAAYAAGYADGKKASAAKTV